jgi:hypothetical protein
MAKKYLDNHEMGILLARWKKDYGDPTTSPLGTVYWVIPNRTPPRLPLLDALFRILINDYGYEEYDFNNSLLNLIRDACVNKDKKDKKKLKGWEDAVKQDLITTICNCFPKDKKELRDVSVEAPPYKEPAKKKAKPPLDMTKHVGFGKSTFETIEEDPFAEFDGIKDE